MRQGIHKIVHWLRAEFKWPLLLFIPVVVTTIELLMYQDFLGWSESGVLKSKLEIAHPALLVAFTLLSLIGWRKFSHLPWVGMSLLGFAFVMREIHFEGSDYLMGVLVLGVLGYAWKNPDSFASLWKADWALSLMAMGFVSYFCSEVLFDRGLIKQPIELIMGDPEWKLPFSTQVEESLETLGGLFLLSSSIVFFRFMNQSRVDSEGA